MQDLMPGRKTAAASQPPASLERHAGDIDLPLPLYEMKSLPGVTARTIRMNPGTLKLRLYRKGETICRQGESGWTAFVILTGDDLRNLPIERDRLMTELPDKITKAKQTNKLEEAETLEATLAELKQKGATLPKPLPGEGPAATVYVDSTPAVTPTFFERWFGKGLVGKNRPRVINIDAPTVVDYGTRKADLPEGALFGEWSCQYGTPRSATIVAARDCYVLEMLRNILNFVLKDEKFKAKVKQNYVSGVLQNHLAGLSFLADLTQEQLAEIREKVGLESYKDGQVIFDRGDPSDCLYIVRRGLVKVLVNDWPLLTTDDIKDVSKLTFTGEAGTFIQAKLGPLPEARDAIVRALNAVLRKRDLTTEAGKPAAALKLLVESTTFKKILAETLPAKPDDWSDQDWRRFNRLVLEAVCPGALRPVTRSDRPESLRRAGSENILRYMTQGDFFGEMGAVSGDPRSATCIAYVHPRPEAGELDAAGDRWRKEEERIELVRVPKQLLLELMAKYPTVREKIDAQIKAYREASARQKQTHGWEGRQPAYQSDRFQELGLVQGQKMMVIDLDRCTRCDECVRACINTHPDGRTRLFLDGPRFGRHLIPTTCRACRDPVCMIGCPVGSIRRGNNLQIVIEDWCIGCQLCSKNCPYGSIQMHDLGLIPQEGHDWQVRGQTGWHDVRLPLLYDADLEAMLALLRTRSLEFRRSFDVKKEHLEGEGGLKLVIATNDAAVKVEGKGKTAKLVGFIPVTLNGIALPLEGWTIEREQYVFELTKTERAKFLHRGRNLLSIKVTAPDTGSGTLLQAAIDLIQSTGAVIPLKAVVCDQCSTLPGSQPACVHACPHDAAKRIDGWNDSIAW